MLCRSTSGLAASDHLAIAVSPGRKVASLLCDHALPTLNTLGYYVYHHSQCKQWRCFCTNYCIITSVNLTNACTSVETIVSLLLSLCEMCVLLYMLLGHCFCYCEECVYASVQAIGHYFCHYEKCVCFCIS